MKFGKLIQSLIDNALPTWRDKFLAYKYLKKRLNSLLAESMRAAEERHGMGMDMGVLPAARSSDVDAFNEHASLLVGEKRSREMHEHGRIRKRRHLLDDAEFRRVLEEEFRRLLDGELDKMNDFVVDKEEEFVMKLQHFNEIVEGLKDAIKDNDQQQLDLINLQKDVVVFHGEMVLLKNYSSLNYRGLVKIVKKHDRLTGAWLRLSFIPDARRQPFYSMDILSRLVRDCESNLLSLFPSCSGESTDQPSFERDTQGSVFEDDSIFSEDVIKHIHKNTMAALQTIRNMSRGSSTYNALSLPPCEEDNEDAGSVVEEE